MLFSVLRMDNRLRLNLFLLALIFGVGVIPKAAEAGKCYKCTIHKDTQEDCPTNFQKYAEDCSFSGYCVNRIKDSEVKSRECAFDPTEFLDCVVEKLGSNCYSDYLDYKSAKEKCSASTSIGGGAGAAAPGREAISEGDSNPNGTAAPPAATVSSSTESGKEIDLEDEQARQGAGPSSTTTTCFCKGDLCNDNNNKKNTGKGTGAGATIALSNRLIFFVIGVAVASTKYSIG